MIPLAHLQPAQQLFKSCAAFSKLNWLLFISWSQRQGNNRAFEHHLVEHLSVLHSSC